MFLHIKVAAAVEVAVADGFHDVVVLDAVAAFEVGDGAGDLQDAVVGAGAHVHAFHGVAKLFQTSGVGLGVFVEQRRDYLSIAVDARFVLEATFLKGSCGNDALADGGTGLAGALLDIWSKSTGCTSICRSMRSSSGPLILLM